MSDLQSRVYRPDPEKCCERCAFDRGVHAKWCEVPARITAEWMAQERAKNANLEPHCLAAQYARWIK